MKNNKNYHYHYDHLEFKDQLLELQDRLNIKHALFIWGKESVMGEQ